MIDQQKSYLLALIVILFWSTVGSALKITLRYISFAELLFYASLVSFILLFFLLLRHKKIFVIFRLSYKDYLRAGILGLLNPFLYYLVLFKAYDLLLAQEAGTLNYIWPVVLVLLSIPLLKQKIGFISIISILISFLGTVVIVTRGSILGLHFSNTLGVMLALGSAFFWSIYWIYNIKDKKNELIKLFLNFGFGLIYIFFYLLLTSGFYMPGFYGIAGSVYIGLFEMGISYILWLKALQFSATTAKISNLVFLSPFISLIIIRFVVGEKIFISTIIGLAMIVGGILLQRLAGKYDKVIS